MIKRKREEKIPECVPTTVFNVYSADVTHLNGKVKLTGSD